MLRWWVALGASTSLCACIDVAGLKEKDGATGGAAGASGGGGAGTGGGGGGVTSFCAGHAGAAFCKDFDDGKPFSFGFNDTEVMPPTAVGLDSVIFVSSPASLRTFIPAGTPDVDSYAYVWRDLDPSALEVTLSFDIWADISTISQSADVASISVDPEGKWHVANLELHPNGARIELGYPDQGGQPIYVDTGLTAFPLKGQWSHVVMHMVRSGPPSLTVSIDGAGAGTVALPSGYTNPGLRFRAGVSFAPSQQQDFTVQYDNILVELK